ncbi:hypothetical protein HB815_12620 [Listeria booriae]|uniref:hypothetical protein n=1 Tax=Listeria booriae TaxID=1552123 RepID=UPI001629F03C|nr:hypothetical protein [Listeria booriae]MBC1211762.1 hypothetical protein [Listeria booriae]
MTEKNIRMVSYVLLLLSLFVGNFYKVQADINGFVKVEGVKGHTIVGEGIGFLLLLFPLLLITLPLYQGKIKQAERFRIGYLIGNMGMMLHLLLFMRHYSGSLDEEWVSISFRLALSGWLYLMLSAVNLIWEWRHYRKMQQSTQER